MNLKNIGSSLVCAVNSEGAGSVAAPLGVLGPRVETVNKPGHEGDHAVSLPNSRCSRRAEPMTCHDSGYGRTKWQFALAAERRDVGPTANR